MSSAARAGGPGVAIANAPPFLYDTLEPKICERCGRSFLRSRSAGTPAIYCHECESFFVDVVAQEKLLKQTRAVEAQKKGEMMTEIQKTPPAPAVTSPKRRLCEVCSAALSHNNITGLCKKHQEAHGKPNGHAKSDARASAKANGHGHGIAAGKVNGHGGRELALEERVDLVLKALPLDEKVRMISSWLRLGEF
jgi:hypothetical protein